MFSDSTLYEESETQRKKIEKRNGNELSVVSLKEDIFSFCQSFSILQFSLGKLD